MTFTAIIHPHIRNIARSDWEKCLPGEAENYDYYTACESLSHEAYKISAIEVRYNNKIAAVAPLFTLTYRLDTPLQGRLRAITDSIIKRFPWFLSFKVLGVGSPLAERCHLGFAPDLSENEQQQALVALLQALEIHAKKFGISLVAIKDIAGEEYTISDVALRAAGYTMTPSLPVAILDLPETEEAYIASLSPSNRTSIRRKLKAAKNLTFEYRTTIKGIEDKIEALYEETRALSNYDYGDLETLPCGYFNTVMQSLNGKALMMLYWLNEELIGFNLLLLHEGKNTQERKVIDKFIGRKNPEARNHNLYFVGWIDNVRYAQNHGYKKLQSGQTAYGEKLRLGSRLEPSYIYFRHRNKVVNAILGFAAKFIAFDKMDKDLQAYKKKNATL